MTAIIPTTVTFSQVSYFPQKQCHFSSWLFSIGYSFCLLQVLPLLMPKQCPFRYPLFGVFRGLSEVIRSSQYCVFCITADSLCVCYRFSITSAFIYTKCFRITNSHVVNPAVFSRTCSCFSLLSVVWKVIILYFRYCPWGLDFPCLPKCMEVSVLYCLS